MKTFSNALFSQLNFRTSITCQTDMTQEVHTHAHPQWYVKGTETDFRETTEIEEVVKKTEVSVGACFQQQRQWFVCGLTVVLELLCGAVTIRGGEKPSC